MRVWIKWRNGVVAAAAMCAAGVAAGGARPLTRGERVPIMERVDLPANGSDLGPADLSAPLDRMTLVLSRTAAASAALREFLSAVQDPASPDYHHWLTPREFGLRFGITDSEIDAVAGWLEDQGLSIDGIPEGRGWINFSGPVSRVETAFATRIHEFSGSSRTRPMRLDPVSAPPEISGLLEGLASLQGSPRRSMGHRSPRVGPGSSSSDSGGHALAPADFAAIYGVAPLHAAGVTGAGTTIAIAGRTEIASSDVSAFRKMFGLPPGDPVIVRNGPSPGNLGGDEEFEADLDVEWSGAVAPNASVSLVVSGSTAATDGIDLSAEYIVDHNLAPIVSVSFGNCESSMGSAGVALYKNLWAQAAAQGMTVFVSSMDSGASGCSFADDSVGSGLAVSGLCASSDDVCVGGTQFQSGSETADLWTPSGARSYIPEGSWNESGGTPGGSGLWATGGGTSAVFAQPAWQKNFPGVPADGRRHVPDVSLAASGATPYLMIQGATPSAPGLLGAEGTSASSPAMAGIMALILQAIGSRQGNVNPVLYRLAATPAASGGAEVFHDIVEGDNSVPGVSGFSAGPGYDSATGLGSLDASALAENWNATAEAADFSLVVTATGDGLAAVSPPSWKVTTSPVAGFSAPIRIECSGVPAGVSVVLSSGAIPAPGGGSATLSLAAATSSGTQAFTLDVSASGGGMTHHQHIAIPALPGLSDSGCPSAAARGCLSPAPAPGPAVIGRR
ncbi:MAG: S53 family peptidase [Thermoanaerobaculia bacterium]